MLRNLLVVVVLILAFTSFSQEEKPLSEKEWKLRCSNAKKQSEDLLARFAEHDALVNKNYRNIFALASFSSSFEAYKKIEGRYKAGIFQLNVLGEDTSGYEFQYMNKVEGTRAAALCDSLNSFRILREFRSLSDFRKKIDWITNYKTQDYNFIVTEYGILDKEMSKQLNYAANLILTDTMMQSALLRKNMERVLECNAFDQPVVFNIFECLKNLRTQYLENPMRVFSPAYDRYFAVYREELNNSGADTSGKPYEIDHFLEKVDEPAEFPGGPEAFGNYISRRLHDSKMIPKNCENIEVQFTLNISRYGVVLDAIALPVEVIPECRRCTIEIMRIVKESPNWFPAKKNGKTVSSAYSIPIVLN